MLTVLLLSRYLVLSVTAKDGRLYDSIGKHLVVNLLHRINAMFCLFRCCGVACHSNLYQAQFLSQYCVCGTAGPALPAAIRGSLISRYGEAAMEAADAGLAGEACGSAAQPLEPLQWHSSCSLRQTSSALIHSVPSTILKQGCAF